MSQRKELFAPEVNADGEHVLVYDGAGVMVENAFYKFKDPASPGEFLTLPDGKVVVRQCRKHSRTSRKLYCVHGKESSKCRWCPLMGQGGGTSFCTHGVRRELCALGCKGTSSGVAKPSMRRKTVASSAAGGGRTGGRSGLGGATPKAPKAAAADSDTDEYSEDADDGWDTDAVSIPEGGDSEEEEAEPATEHFDSEAEGVAEKAPLPLPGNRLCAYELQRLSNMASNKSFLDELDAKFYNAPPPTAKRAPTKKRTKKPAAPQQPARKQPRRAAANDAVYYPPTDAEGEE